jgi:hypothetical protein
MTEPALPHALAWARHGHGVFPLHYPVKHNDQVACSCGRLCGKHAAKHPYAVRGFAPHGCLDATLNPRLIERWFGLCLPNANLGVSTENLVVVDVDPRDGGDESLRALEREHGELLPTWRALTGGGEHIIFAAADGVEIYNVVANQMTDPPLGPGIDVRARGGYIVGVPSRHMSGGVYAWSVDHHPATTPLAPAPDWLVEKLTARGTATSPDGGSAEPIPSDTWAKLTRQPVIEYRDKAACRIAGHFFRHSCDYELVLGMLHAWNTTWCKPPLDHDELKDVVDRIALREANRIRAQLNRGE